jgi:uncharacterized protein (DUF1697 family)
MSRFVALLRGVNIGKGNRVPMAELRAILKELGCKSVSTTLNSGHAVFTSPDRSVQKHAVAVAAALQERLGVTTSAVVESAAELSAVVAASPMGVGLTLT